MHVANNGAADWGQSALPSFDGQFDAGALSLTPRNGTEWGHACGDQWRGRLGTIGPTVIDGHFDAVGVGVERTVSHTLAGTTCCCTLVVYARQDNKRTTTRFRPNGRARLTAVSRRRPPSSSAKATEDEPGLPVSDATRKVALRAKDTERGAFRFIRVLRPSGRISVTRGKPKTQRVDGGASDSGRAFILRSLGVGGCSGPLTLAPTSIARQGDSASPAFPRFPCQNPPHGIDAA